MATEAPAAMPAEAAAMSHVRPVSEHARQMIADGVARSSTIVRLITELAGTNVIAFIETRIDPEIPTAETMLMTTAGGFRYVHVIINAKLALDERVEYLGHELQHVVEIAQDAAAVDSTSVRKRFAAIGREVSGSVLRQKAFETDGARLVSVAVRRELSVSKREIESH